MLSSRLIYHYERTLFSLRVTLLSQPEIAKSGAFVQNQIFLVSQSKLFFGVGIHIINNKAVCSYFAVLQTRCYRLIYNWLVKGRFNILFKIQRIDAAKLH